MTKRLYSKILCSIAALGSVALFALSGCTPMQEKPSLNQTAKSAQKEIVAIENKHRVAVGLSLRDEKANVLLEWRSRERFPLTSTVKALQCARVYDLGLEKVQARIDTVKAVSHSPVFGSLAPETEVTLKDACRAALSKSDNRAANFIFAHTGGPKALTVWLRQKGDATTRSDRTEPDLNTFTPNEYRDTTTPSNASLTWQRLDAAMPQSARNQWLEDLASNVGSSNLLRAQLPEGWRLYDRTGAGSDAFGATRAIHAILVSDESNRYYAAIHLKAPAQTPLSQRDAVMQEVIDVLYRVLE